MASGDVEIKKKMAFEELKKRLEGHMESDMYHDDSLFYRFLIARDFKIDLAESMLKEHLEWRKKYDVKNIIKYKPPEVLERYLSMVFLGHDEEGHVVRYVPTGNFDCKGLLASCTVEDWEKNMIKFFEEDLLKLKNQSKKLGKVVDKVVYIHDLEHLTLGKVTDKKAPTYFSILYSLMKKILPNKIMKKIKVYSDDSFKSEFLQKMDAEILPVFLGGTKTDPDGNPECNTFRNRAGIVPEKYYIQKNKPSLAGVPGVQKITVSRGSSEEVIFEVTEVGTYLEWQFELKSNDIKFGISWQSPEEERKELIPLQKVNTYGSPESGIYDCEKTGTYIVQFDNTDSYFTSKEIFYIIKLRSSQKESPDFIS